MILTGAIERFTMTTAVTYLMAVGSQILNFISNNTLLFTLFSGSIVSFGCVVVRKIKKTSKI